MKMDDVGSDDVVSGVSIYEINLLIITFEFQYAPHMMKQMKHNSDIFGVEIQCTICIKWLHVHKIDCCFEWNICIKCQRVIHAVSRDHVNLDIILLIECCSPK